MNRKTCMALILAAAVILPLAAHAQKKDRKAVLRREETCEILPESISSLYPPRLASPSQWEAVYSVQDADVRFSAGLPLANGNVLAIGRVLPHDLTLSAQFTLVELNNRNRAVAEKTWPAKNEELPVQILPAGSGYLALSNLRDKKSDKFKARLSWYDTKYDYRREIVLGEPARDYKGAGMIPNPAGKGFLLYLNASSSTGQGSAIVISLDEKGQQVWKREYVSGAASEVFGFDPVPGGFVLSGRKKLDSGRWVGWLTKIDANGILMWEQAYPRGLSAVIKHVRPLTNDAATGFVVAGESRSTADGLDAIWLGSLNAAGDRFEWQRYIRRHDNGFTLAGFELLDDGRMQMVLNTVPTKKSGQRAHIRILTLKKRGPVMEDFSYIEGVESRAFDFLVDQTDAKRHRVVISTILSDDKPMDIEMIGGSFVVRDSGEAQAVKDEKSKQSSRGWVFVMSAPAAYRDPCDEPFAP